ncbi:endopeptidase [Escherichia coli]|nr:endopeptidase [Escherichia coli]
MGVIKKVCAHIFLPQSAFCLLNITRGHIAAKVTAMLEYTYRLRASAMHTDTGRPNEAYDRTATTSSMTYCQAVLWIKPLLALIEKGNNNFSSIREIDELRYRPSEHGQ